MYLGTGHKDFGADMNIRGGQKGFMRSLAEGRFLAWPDYVGHLGGAPPFFCFPSPAVRLR